jgi:hypothetical protein
VSLSSTTIVVSDWYGWSLDKTLFRFHIPDVNTCKNFGSGLTVFLKNLVAMKKPTRKPFRAVIEISEI